MMKRNALWPTLAATMLLGCASAGPTPELVAARTAYDKAARGPAASYEPDRLLVAKQALERAEMAHDDDAGSYKERQMSYLAYRAAEMAAYYGQAAVNKADRKRAEQAYAAESEAMAERAVAKIGHSEDALARERAERQALEQKLRSCQLGQVSEEERGLVLTVNGQVLFAFGKSDLLPAAKDRLLEVALPLHDLPAGQMITVIGHTDSIGSDASNMKLSFDRAEAVRTFLISQGVAADRIKAKGMGETMPVSNNTTPDGRANNRRVELVIGREPVELPGAKVEPQQQQQK
jgi:outer membrane protein OmpA-like peptidoglycan-associated protein